MVQGSVVLVGSVAVVSDRLGDMQLAFERSSFIQRRIASTFHTNHYQYSSAGVPGIALKLSATSEQVRQGPPYK